MPTRIEKLKSSLASEEPLDGVYGDYGDIVEGANLILLASDIRALLKAEKDASHLEGFNSAVENINNQIGISYLDGRFSQPGPDDIRIKEERAYREGFDAAVRDMQATVKKTDNRAFNAPYEVKIDSQEISSDYVVKKEFSKEELDALLPPKTPFVFVDSPSAEQKCEWCEKGFGFYADQPTIHFIKNEDGSAWSSRWCKRRQKPTISKILRAAAKGYLMPFCDSTTGTFDPAAYQQAKSVSGALNAIAAVYEAHEKALEQK